MLICGNNLQELPKLPDNSIDSIVTDPPYELGFMGKTWDSTGIAYNTEVWQQCLRVLKPGGHLLAFGGSRTYHRLACAIEDAGFQIRDQIMWVYGSGFPKSLNISKAIDKAAGAEREVVGSKLGQAGYHLQGHSSSTGAFNHGLGSSTPETRLASSLVTAPATDEAKEWDGWGTALKPAHEPIVLARKPLDGTVANNVLTYGVGGINIDGCRVPSPDNDGKVWIRGGDGVNARSGSKQAQDNPQLNGETHTVEPNALGRFPANFIHDGSDELLELFPSVKADESAARFFYCAKASKKDRNEGLEGFAEWTWKDQGFRDNDSTHLSPRAGAGRTSSNANHHPTVKPTDLMRYLCRLITPPNGTVLDPFTGSGSTGKAAALEGFNFIGIEQSAEYAEIAQARINHAKENK